MRVPFSDLRAEYMNTSERKVFDLAPDGLLEIPSLGWCHYAYARPDLPVHHHFGVLEFHYLEKGHLVFEVEGQLHHLHGGDLFVTQPGESHSTGGQPVEPCTLYWLHVRVPKTGRPLFLLPVKESTRMLAALQSFPSRQFRGNLQVKTIFDRLLELHAQTNTPFRITRLRQFMVQLMLEMVDCSVRHEVADCAAIIQEIVQMIRSRPTEDFRLQDLARAAGVSLSWFMMKFKQETGLTPRQFIVRSKVDAACDRLRSQKDSITKIGGDLGFPTSQYFATVFRRVTGMSPRRFRQEGSQRRPSQRREDSQM